MGASDYFTLVKDHKTAKQAFDFAVEVAKSNDRSEGYTGTIAEKKNFKFVCEPVASYEKACELANKLFDEDDSDIIGDKWSPANCIEIKKSDSVSWYLFFGYSPT